MVLLVSALLLELVAVFVCVLKGKPWFAALGVLLLGVFAIIGALRRAKPHSWWAQRYYGPREMEAAMRRFPRSADRIEAWR